MIQDNRLIPVIAAIGEAVDRPADVSDALEPVALMAAAMRAAEADAGAAILGRIEDVDLVGLISWPYENPVGLLCEQLSITPARAANTSMGGETPIRLLHEAALRIARGEISVAAIVGGEASHSANRAARDKVRLPWTTPAKREEAVRYASSSFAIGQPAKTLGMHDPAQIYPFYELAVQHAAGQSPSEARRENGELWHRFAQVAATNPSAWLRDPPPAETIATPSTDNRLINWPYPKFMVANPMVNQACAIVVMSLAAALEAGIAEDKLIHIWGGAEAKEPEDYLLRDSFAHSTAQACVLEASTAIAGGADRINHFELYSCFPVVPKMALASLGEAARSKPPTVTGGLTFFGGPFNNYMSHSVAAMARLLRSHPGEIGLLYGQGGYVNKHHALVVSTSAPPTALALAYSVQSAADARRGPSPEVVGGYAGPATIETYTVRYARDGQPLDGIVIARTAEGARTMARVPVSDEDSMALLLSEERNAIGEAGQIATDVFGKSVWTCAKAAALPRPPRFAKVEREGPLTIVTIERPEAMNALHPEANAELARIFDDFEADPEQWVAIITGSGRKAFSSGNDLKYTAQAMARGARVEFPTSGFAGLTRRFTITKPLIAAVNGIAMGGGFEIALACDIVVAAQSATFALPEPRVGLAALEGGFHRLQLEIGYKRAMGMILTGRRVSADEGAALGFVNEVVADDDLLDSARQWAAQIMECSPMSVRASKQAAWYGANEASLADALANQSSYPAMKALFKSADFREGPLAFAQKRAPQWKGK